MNYEVYHYNSFIKNIISNNIKNLNNSKLKVALFNSDFIFNPKDDNFYDLDNEIEFEDYQKGGKLIKDSKISFDKEKITLKAKDTIWSDTNIKANYAVVYDDTNNKEDKKLLFCVNFKKQRTPNYKDDFIVSWNDFGIFSITKKLNKYNINNDLLDFLENPDNYNQIDSSSIIRKSLDVILGNYSLLCSFMTFKHFLSTIFKNDYLFDVFINNDVFLKMLILYDKTFNALYVQSKESPLDILIKNSKALAKATSNNKFIEELSNNPLSIIYNVSNYSKLLVYASDNKNYKLDTNKYQSFKYLANENKEIEEAFKQSENVKF